ncbi:hypothetical protein Q2392_25265, partial [Escherichia coli]|nr:hypothetical protein [Escherichia coli]
FRPYKTPPLFPFFFFFFLPSLFLHPGVSPCRPGPPSPPASVAPSGRRPRPRGAFAGPPASLRRTRWRGFGLSLRSDA